MNTLFRSVSPALAGGFLGLHLVMPWFLPVAILIGLMGFKIGMEEGHLSMGKRRRLDRWLILLVAWMPAFCWLMAQFVQQY